MDSATYGYYGETAPIEQGIYKVMFYRNKNGACSKEEATEVIIHYHNAGGVLVHCEYHKL